VTQQCHEALDPLGEGICEHAAMEMDKDGVRWRTRRQAVAAVAKAQREGAGLFGTLDASLRDLCGTP
jgi:hypothetical protein